MFNPIKWLLNKEEPSIKETAMSDTSAVTKNPMSENETSVVATENPEAETQASDVVAQTPKEVAEMPVAVNENREGETETSAADAESSTAEAGSNTEAAPGTETVLNTIKEDTLPAAEVKAGVNDFDAALAFVEYGLAKLGEAAKDELKMLAKKYL